MKTLYRSTTDKYIAGVFGGAGEIFEIDPNILRLIAVFLGIATGIIPFVVAYIVAWAILPQTPPVEK